MIGVSDIGLPTQNLQRWRLRYETSKALAVAVAAHDRPLAAPCVAHVLQAACTPSQVLSHLPDAWCMQSWDA